jgi:hypothetical protein
VVVTDQDIKTNQDFKEVIVVEPYALNLQIADVTNIYHG